MSRQSPLVILLFAALACRAVNAQAPLTATAAITPSPFNLAWKTLGGEQFWSDELVHGAWRIQRNALSGHHRLLDPAEVRRAWGTWEQCKAAFDEHKSSRAIPPLTGRAVITLHGFGRSRDHMAGLGKFLEQDGAFTWINVSYASTRGTLGDHAATLAKVIEGLEGIDEIYFVGHSLGNLVVRRYLGEGACTQPRWTPDPRIQRMVMLGPPNNGAQMAQLLAELLHDNELVRTVMGPSAWQLARDWDEAKTRLATPRFEFGVLAGGCGDNVGLNPLLAGDDDLVVRVEETRLPGATDFRLVNCRHGQLMNDAAVRQQVLTFLHHGYFTAAEERQPIADAVAAAPPAQP